MIKCGLETEKKKKEAQKYEMGSEKTYMILKRERETSLIKRAESCLEKIFIDRRIKVKKMTIARGRGEETCRSKEGILKEKDQCERFSLSIILF